MKKLTTLFLLSLCTFLFAKGATAESQQYAAHVYSTALQSHNSVPAGETITLGVGFEMEPMWHIYWQNPGDAGLPTEITWQSDALQPATALQFQTPVRFDTGDIVNYGYSHQTLAWQNFTVPENTTVGSVIPYTVNVSYLSCKDICLPGSVTLTGMFTVGEPSAKPDVSENISYFITAAKNTPVEAPASFNVETTVTDEDASLTFTTVDDMLSANDVRFVPAKESMIVDDAPVLFEAINEKAAEHTYKLTFKKDDYWAAENISGLSGLLVIHGQGYLVGYTETDTPVWKPAAGDTFAEKTPQNTTENSIDSYEKSLETAVMVEETGAEKTSLTFPLALLFSFIGGLILNLMPCVLPVLSLKVMGLIHHAREESGWKHGISYTFGILTTFAIIAIMLLGLRAGGEELGWGFQLQSPLFVATLSLLMMLVGLQLFGVFELGHSFSKLGGLARGNGLGATYFSGVLMTLVATPCTAPFMAPAFGFALTQPFVISLSVFLALGIGLAFPYLMITLQPKLVKVLPKPGPWEETFKIFLGFPMLATALWLLWVYGKQTSFAETFVVLSLLLFIAFISWVFGKISGLNKSKARNRFALILWLSSLLIFFVGTGAFSSKVMPSESNEPTVSSLWKTWQKEAVEQDVKDGKTVFVDFTADWCITCKFNENIALREGQMRDYMKNRNVVFYSADWTKKDAGITEELSAFNRAGVPLYLVYKNGNMVPEILPQILTSTIVETALK